jgi:hypothetical protein
MSDEKLDTVTSKYDPTVTAIKGVVEGGSSAAIVTAAAALIVEALKAKNPALQIGTAEVSLVLGAVSGVLVGMFKSFRNWYKNSKKTTT